MQYLGNRKLILRSQIIRMAEFVAYFIILTLASVKSSNGDSSTNDISATIKDVDAPKTPLVSINLFINGKVTASGTIGLTDGTFDTSDDIDKIDVINSSIETYIENDDTSEDITTNESDDAELVASDFAAVGSSAECDDAAICDQSTVTSEEIEQKTSNEVNESAESNEEMPVTGTLKFGGKIHASGRVMLSGRSGMRFGARPPFFTTSTTKPAPSWIMTAFAQVLPYVIRHSPNTNVIQTNLMSIPNMNAMSRMTASNRLAMNSNTRSSMPIAKCSYLNARSNGYDNHGFPSILRAKNYNDKNVICTTSDEDLKFVVPMMQLEEMKPTVPMQTMTVTSGSPTPKPLGIEIRADNLEIGGNLAVKGRMPFNGAVNINGNLQTGGKGRVNYQSETI